MKFDYKKIENIEFGDVHSFDAPDYCDAYIDYAEYDGRVMTDEEIDELNDNHCDFVQESLFDHLN